MELFAKNIISTYCDAFERLDTNNRISMVHLLKTWVGVLPQAKVSAIQERISSFVPSNPSPQAANQPNAIHVNPKYLQRTGDGVCDVYNTLSPLFFISLQRFLFSSIFPHLASPFYRVIILFLSSHSLPPNISF